MPQAPAKLQFVSSLFTNKIFLAQVVAVIATILNAAGYRILDDPGTQQQAITLLDGMAVIIMQLLFQSGPVSISGPVSTPPSRDVQAGTSVITVASQAEQLATEANAVQKLDVGEHTVSVLPPAAPGIAVPADVVVQKVR